MQPVKDTLVKGENALEKDLQKSNFQEKDIGASGKGKEKQRNEEKKEDVEPRLNT